MCRSRLSKAANLLFKIAFFKDFTLANLFMILVASISHRSSFFIPGVSNSNCSVGHMRTYKVTRGPHYKAEATVEVPELTRNSFFILFLDLIRK